MKGWAEFWRTPISLALAAFLRSAISHFHMERLYLEKERLILSCAGDESNESKAHIDYSRIAPTRIELEKLYARYNRREFIHPDPLEFVYRYEEVGDREIAGIIAALLAYGRVKQILRSVAVVLERMGPSPDVFSKTSSKSSLMKTFKDFKHRFTTGEELVILLVGLQRVLGELRVPGSMFFARHAVRKFRCSSGSGGICERTGRRPVSVREYVCALPGTGECVQTTEPVSALDGAVSTTWIRVSGKGFPLHHSSSPWIRTCTGLRSR